MQLDSLSFSRQETAEYLNARMHLGLSPEQITSLEQRTEGWPAGLQLAAVSLRWVQDRAAGVAAENVIETYSGSQRQVMDYLVNDVLNRQPLEVRDFILKTSILVRFCASLCDAVTQTTNSLVRLEDLERSSLFLIPLDGKRNWYRYHSLWAEAMQALLKKENLDLFPELHQRAANWFKTQGLVEEAVQHAIWAGDFRSAAAWIEPHARQMVLHGEGGLLLRWLEKLPAERIEEWDELLIAQGWSWLAEGQIDRIEPAFAAFKGRPALHPQLLGEMAALRAMVAMVHQETAVMQEQAVIAFENLPLEDRMVRSVVNFSLGTALLLAGQVARAIELLGQSVQESRLEKNELLNLVATSSLAQAYELFGQFDQAARLHRAIIALENHPVIGKLPLIGLGYVGLGGVLHEWLQYSESQAALEKGLAIGQRWGSPEILIGGYFSLARLRYTQGDLNGALEILDLLERDFLNASPTQERDHILATRARIALEQGNTALADEWANRKATGFHPWNYTNESQILIRVLIAAI